MKVRIHTLQPSLFSIKLRLFYRQYINLRHFYQNIVTFLFLNIYFFLFYLYHYIYPPDAQESDGGAIHRVSNYPDLLPEMPRYCCPLVIK